MQPLKTKRIEIPCFVHWAKEQWEQEGRFTVFSFDDASAMGWTLVGPHTVVFEMPEGFDPTQAKLNLLKKQKENLTQEFNARIQEINEQISNLQCLEYSPTIPGMETEA